MNRSDTERKTGALMANGLSPKAMKHALWRHTVKHWSTRYMWLPLAGFAGAGIVFGFSEVVLALLAGSFGLACFPWMYHLCFRADRFGQEYVQELKGKMQQEMERRRSRLKGELLKCGCTDGADQLEQFEGKIDAFTEVLNYKLSPRELMYARLQITALEVFLSGIDNLSLIVSAYKSIAEIDVDYINRRLRTLYRDDQSDSDVTSETKALQSQLDMRESQLERIDHLLHENGQALAKLDEATVTISAIDPLDSQAKIDMENSMKFLSEVVERAKRLGKEEPTIFEEEK